MKKNIIYLLIILLVIIVIFASWWYLKPAEPKMPFVGSASFLCQDNKTIEANFYQGTPAPVNSGEMPIPNGSVSLKLSDGRNLTLPQTISASGIRYANSDESIVFWSKGDTAFITEQNNNETYSGCVSKS